MKPKLMRFSLPRLSGNRSFAQPAKDETGNLKFMMTLAWCSGQARKASREYFNQEIENCSWTVAILIACYFVSGLVDGVAFGVYGIFCAMQTGNTIFLALRFSNPLNVHHPLHYVKCLVSIGCYCLGALIFNSLHRLPSGFSSSKVSLQRWTLTTSFVVQAVLLLITAALAQSHAISDETVACGTFSSHRTPGDHYLDLLGIGLLALESAGQVSLSRALLINELPTIVLSTLYHDLVGEALTTVPCWKESKGLCDFIRKQKRQVRRLACIIALFSGALIGGFMFRRTAELSGVLWLAAGIKTAIAICWIFWKREASPVAVV